MKIRLVKAWNGQSIGAILEPPIESVATTLIERGIAVEISPVEPFSTTGQTRTPKTASGASKANVAQSRQAK
jgi:hypothetical protein